MDKQHLSKPNRKSIRLKGWDYRSPAYYFVTICTLNKKPLFASPIFHDLAVNAIQAIPEQAHAKHIHIDESIIMPDHAHLIIVFDDYPPQADMSVKQEQFENALAGSLGVIVGQYKRSVTTKINQLRKSVGSAVWQSGYYERIIRDERELQATRRYIINNPIRLAEKRENLNRLSEKMTYHP